MFSAMITAPSTMIPKSMAPNDSKFAEFRPALMDVDRDYSAVPIRTVSNALPFGKIGARARSEGDDHRVCAAIYFL
jgi:hypothetical protein